MKHILTGLLFLLNGWFVCAQENTETIFLQTKSKIHLYYIGLRPADAIVYRMGVHRGKNGGGHAHSILHIDTLGRQPDGAFGSANARLVSENNEACLIIQDKKTLKFRLDTVTDLKGLYADLNKAYYVDHFFAMRDTLNKKYRLNYYDFRNGHYTWNALPNKDTPCSYFRAFANNGIAGIKDSITVVQDRYITLTGEVFHNLKTISYETLKQSLAKLPTPADHDNRYFRSIVEEVSKQQPVYFFRLAEDFPKFEDDIYSAAANSKKEVIRRLREVQGHDVVKKRFLRYRRSKKGLVYRAIVSYGAVAGLIIMLI